MFVSYSHLIRQWYWIYPGGEEKIAEPQMLLLDEEYARAHRLEKSSPRRENPLRIRKSKNEQLLFAGI